MQVGILKENETFVINRANYERLLRDNKDFSEMINTGRYVYIGYVVCLLDSKYIDIVSSSDDVELVLTDYAREHAEKCCIRFKKTIAIQPHTNFPIYNHYPQLKENSKVDDFGIALIYLTFSLFAIF